MNLKKKIILTICLLFLYSCTDYKISSDIEKKYYSSKGFALIFQDKLYDQKIVSKKVKNDQIYVLHSFLKSNTSIRIINPSNSNFVDAKVNKNADYPKIFNIVISNKNCSGVKS